MFVDKISGAQGLLAGRRQGIFAGHCKELADTAGCSGREPPTEDGDKTLGWLFVPAPRWKNFPSGGLANGIQFVISTRMPIGSCA